ncbi:NAD(P)H-dependent flavin oxidoreductase [Ornithinibacillus xuwenensis]|uniref:Probable nitronate monooxygenase n=1 Tax=Ornithinibacillus xuwenensis TaxID=3144668 RepID=A0ABU9XJI3_9BACI
MLNTSIMKQLEIKYPIIQAPMAGGITTSKLVAEVSNYGGLGMIGAGYMSPDQICTQIREIKQLTNHSFGINLFVPSEFEVTEDEIMHAKRVMQPHYEQLNVQINENLEIPYYQQALETFHEQVQVVMEERVSVCSFTFGIPSKEVIENLKQCGILVIGTATTVREAIEIEKSGMDMVVVQGSEAGGHRGNFLEGHKESLVGLMSLIPQVVDQVAIPVIAAGGIMDGRGVMASIHLGAEGVQMGTAFLTCVESGASDVHREAILQSHEDQTIFTRSFSGKYARAIRNTFTLSMQKHEAALPVFPVQNTLTKGLRQAAKAHNDREHMSLWSGQSPRLAKNQTVHDLMRTIIQEVDEIHERLK